MKNHLHTKYILLVFVLTCWCSLASAQTLDTRISLQLKKVSLDAAIQEISKAGHVFFSYSPQSVDLSKVISIRVKNKPIREVLDALLVKNGIVYYQLENQIILKANQEKIPDEKRPATKNSQQLYTISGNLRDQTSGEALIGAYAYARGTNLGTSTNGYGYYSLSLPAGTYEIVFSIIGYEPITMNIALNEDQRVSVGLTEIRTEMEAVEIKSDDEQEILQNTQSGIARIDNRMLEQLPGIAGDIDIVKSLQSIPGIKSFGDGSALFYTRGGKSDQNLIMVDDAPVFNPSHLFGFVSVLAPEAIKDMSVYKGDAPANLGGRLSSVVDIRTRDGNNRRFGAAGNIGLFVSDLAVEGPFKKDKASWLITGRISNLNWLFKNSVVDRNFRMNFFDLNTKMNFQLNKNNRLFLTFYYGMDAFTRTNYTTNKTFGINWNNLLGVIRWNHIFNRKLFSNTTVFYSRYNYLLFLNKDANDYWKSSISIASIKMDFSWYLNPSNTIRLGFETGPQYSDPGNTYFHDENLINRVRVISKYNAMDYVLYACNDQLLGEKVNLKYGIRLNLWQDFGSYRVFILGSDYQAIDTLYPDKNEVYCTYFRPEPRFILNYMPGQHNNIRFGYARSNQFVQVLNNTSGPFTSMESWVHCGPNIKPQASDLLSVGYFHRLFKGRVAISAEAYYRQFYNTVDYADHADLLYNPVLEAELRFGKSWSYGLELMIRKSSGKFTGWISYTFSRAWTRINDINESRPYDANFDVPHDLSINISYDTYKRWMFVMNWVYHTGSPISTPTAFYYYNGVAIPYYGERNNDRLPDYHRLDLSVIFRLSKPERRFQHNLSLNIFNVYARKNPFALNFSKFNDGNGNFLIPTDADGSYEIVPTSTSVAGIIPSINYKFRF